VRFFESRWRGYLRCVAEPRSWMTDLRVVDTVERPGAPVRTLASFVVEDGRPGPQHARAGFGAPLASFTLSTRLWAGCWERLHP
jgi:hypothetical protein